MKAARIVLIEDNPADVFLFELALRENKIQYELTRFKDGTAAVSALCSSGTVADRVPIDAIFLDLNTPGSDGFDVLGQLRRNSSLTGVPIAIFSSSQSRTDKQKSAVTGADRYIEKPSRLNEFLETVGRAVREMLQPVP